jgi:hypothetical protein
MGYAEYVGQQVLFSWDRNGMHMDYVLSNKRIIQDGIY